MQNLKRQSAGGKKSPVKAAGEKIPSNKKTQLLTKNKKTPIKSKEVYNATMKEIDLLMKRGENNLGSKDLMRLRSLAEAAELYEDTHDPLPLPESLPEMIRLRMFQLQLSQHFAAKLLGVSDAKLSLIMAGKQRPDIYFLKALHSKFNVDANLILQAL